MIQNVEMTARYSKDFIFERPVLKDTCEQPLDDHTNASKPLVQHPRIAAPLCLTSSRIAANRPVHLPHRALFNPVAFWKCAE